MPWRLFRFHESLESHYTIYSGGCCCFIGCGTDPGIGREVNGASAGFPVEPVNIQPSEIYKLATILYIASFITRREEVLHNFKKGLLPVVMIMTIGLTLIMGSLILVLL